MSVGELIKELSKYDDNLEVVIGVYSCPSSICDVEKTVLNQDDLGNFYWAGEMDTPAIIINPEITA